DLVDRIDGKLILLQRHDRFPDAPFAQVRCAFLHFRTGHGYIEIYELSIVIREDALVRNDPGIARGHFFLGGFRIEFQALEPAVIRGIVELEIETVASRRELAEKELRHTGVEIVSAQVWIPSKGEHA